MDVFNLELELPTPTTHSMYSCSLESTTSSLPEIDEARTPLLYDSRISRNNSLVPSLEEHMIDTLDLGEASWNTLAPQYTLSMPNKSSMGVMDGLYGTSAIEETIEKGTTSLKNNYKLWLSSH